MLVAIYFFHALAFLIGFVYLIPTNRDGDYKKLFCKHLPTFYSMIFWLYFIVMFYFLIDSFAMGSIGVNYIDSFDTKKCYIIMSIYAVAIFILLFTIVKSEIVNVSEELIKERLWAEPFIYILLYTTSVLLSVVFFHFTNRFLDFSTPEEHVVTVTSSYRKSMGRGRNRTTHFEITFKPSVHKLNKLEVSSGTQHRVSSDNKIKIYVYKGLYGLRYVSNSIDLK